MRVTTLVFSGIIALASAQSSSPPTTTPTTTSTPSTTWGLTPAQSSQASCLGACKKGDVDCQAKCVGAPNPDAADVNATNKCVAECPKGKGTATDNVNYANCVDGCIRNHFLTTTSVPATATGGSGGSGGSGGASGTNGSPTSGTGASTTPSAKSGAATIAGSGMGLLGFLAAALAL